MKVNGKYYKTIWNFGNSVFMIDQNQLPFKFRIYEARTYKESCEAIKTMKIRGAGAIGVCAGFAMAQAFNESAHKTIAEYTERARNEIEATRPTARNLFYATEQVFNAGCKSANNALEKAKELAIEDEESSRKIGIEGAKLIKDGYRIGTHCNAGWLAFVDYGTALSAIYLSKQEGKNIFVYVDETRPRGQGAKLTAWELSNEKIPHTIIADSAGAHLMSEGKIDMFIAGADRIARNGDVANKIGTLEKAIIAKEFNIPFYIAAPFSTIDFRIFSGKQITIEERSGDEGLYAWGMNKENEIEKVRIASPDSDYYNPAFDVTPAKYITGIITERGIFKPEEIEMQEKK